MNRNIVHAFLIPLNIFLIFIYLPKKSFGAHYLYEACGPVNCGSGPNISFPFYTGGSQESYCGIPGFGITCSPSGRPILQLHENKYVVEDIFYQNRSLRVSIDDAVSSWGGSRCFSGIQNTTLPTDLFNYVSPATLHLFSNCRIRLPNDLWSYQVYCREEDGNLTLALYGNNVNLRNAMQVCERNVVVPVQGYGFEGSNRIVMNVADVLGKGFVMNWNASDCNTCESSGGHCGTYGTDFHFMCFCPDGPHSKRCIRGNKISKHTLLIGGMSVSGFVATVIFVVLLIFCKKKKGVSLKLIGLRNTEIEKEMDVEAFLRNHGNLVHKRYKYSDLKNITSSFEHTLGKGGYGSVYKGKLPNGRLVAVKILNESKGNGEDFINEVASISRTSHVNIVALLGFCCEGSKRALIYDFMPNGSLDTFLPGENATTICCTLKWKKLFEIAVGIARGLEYLHKGCNTRILHFDIKPQNILLDENFNPKISDFGLARLCPNRSSVVLMLGARGTIGYIAPEVFCRNYGEVSHKSDVYSYGMMVLEMVVGRQQNVQGSHTTDMYFPDWIYKNLEENNTSGTVNGEDHNDQFARKMTIVGLWCIQTKPKNRPPINRVIEMLEGDIELLEIPPRPFMSSPVVAASSSGVLMSVSD